jgi:retinol dehydrogenase 12
MEKTVSSTKRLFGKVCLVTGGNSGIGKEAALGLARLGATVIIVCRNRSKGEAAVSEMRGKSVNENVDLLVADLSSMQSVRELAQTFLEKYSELHVLINNAGTYLPKRVVTVDGYEAVFATNHLGHFLLTNLVLDRLKASAPSRIINVTSDAHRGAEIDFEDLMQEKKFSGFKAYHQSKLANVLFTYELARLLEGTGITVNCLHPGVVRTGFGKDMGGLFSIGVKLMGPFMMSPEKAARAVVYLASSPELDHVNGKFFSKGKERESSRESYDKAAAERLWRVSTELTKLSLTA